MADPRRRLQAIAGSLGESASDPEIRVGEDRVVFSSRPSGILAHVLLLIILFAPPILVVLEGRATSNLVVALFWLLVFGRSFLSLLATDVETTIDATQRVLSVASTNPLHLWLKRYGLGLRYAWEGEYDWGSLQEIRVGHKIHTRALQGFLVTCSTAERRGIPIAEFKEKRVAEEVAGCLRGLLLDEASSLC